MKKELKNTEALIVLVVSKSTITNKTSIPFELGSYVVNRCHKPAQQKAIDTFITAEADHFIYHMPFCYRLN